MEGSSQHGIIHDRAGDNLLEVYPLFAVNVIRFLRHFHWRWKCARGVIKLQSTSPEDEDTKSTQRTRVETRPEKRADERIAIEPANGISELASGEWEVGRRGRCEVAVGGLEVGRAAPLRGDDIDWWPRRR